MSAGADGFSAAAFAAGRPQIVARTLIADLETPVSAFLKIAHGRPYAFLLESVQGGETLGRYSIIGFEPDLVWRCRDGAAELDEGQGFRPESGEVLASLRRLIARARIELPHGMPPMAAGVFGYLGYEMVRLFEKLPQSNPDPLKLPDAVLVRPSVTAIFDNVRGEITLVAPVWPGSGDADGARRAAEARLDAAVARLAAALPRLEGGDAAWPSADLLKSNTPKADYLAMVEKAKEYIAAGDIFQVVPSQRFAMPFALPPFALYRSLRRLNPSPFLYFLGFPDCAIVGSSPEILVRLRGGKVTIRPIAGTLPRGATPEADLANERRLLADPKERAEHLMLLDLGRNDVGRVAKTGTVKVTDAFVIERYSHVMHIVSNVEGEIDPRHDAVDALGAGMPAGTVSGAPKVRAMEIIDELEAEKRGVYAGAVGYFAADGSMDTCIVLRTGIVKDGTLYVQAGGGVVADSDPESEFQETVNKARAIVSAAENAVRFVDGAGPNG
jgi:anthranilate synthase component 1